MLKFFIIGFLISCIFGYNFGGKEGVTIFIFVYIIFSFVLYILKYIFISNKKRLYTSYIRDIWRRVFNRVYIFIIFFSPGLFVFLGENNSLQSKIDSYFLCLMLLFNIGILVFIFWSIIKTILLLFNRVVYEIDPKMKIL